MSTCRHPDRHEPRLVCGYPLPCPHHTVTISGDNERVVLEQPQQVHIGEKTVSKLLDLAEAVTSGMMMELPDGSGCMCISLPLPKNHWSTAPENEEPPPPIHNRTRENELRVRDAVRWAYRASTMNGADTDMDPDALVQNVQFALLGPVTRNLCRQVQCPTCESPDPKRHPAMQFEGEVQLCQDPWHSEE